MLNFLLCFFHFYLFVGDKFSVMNYEFETLLLVFNITRKHLYIVIPESDPSRVISFARDVTVSTSNALELRCMNSAIYYIVAKLGKNFLLDIDILPLQGLAWQTNMVSFLCHRST